MANQNIFGSNRGWRGLQTRVNHAARTAVATAMLALVAACGGDGVAVVGGDLQVLPGTTDMFPNTPVTFSISGGQRPYTVFSSNSSILPLNLTITSGSTFVATATNPSTDISVTITVRDSTGKTATATVAVKTAVLLNAITILRSFNFAACGGQDVCTGSEAVASVTAQSNGGPLVGRTIRFDILTGALGIVSGSTVVSTLTVAADSRGVAIITLRAPVGVPNQYSTIRATDITSGQSVSYVLTIGQTIDPSAIAITPNAFTWTAAFSDRCVSGGLTSHLITGGTPPYAVGQSIPGAAILTGSPPGPVGQVVPAETVATVGRNFGSLLVMVTGTVCSVGAGGNIITVTDAIGRVATLNIGNRLGDAVPPAAGAAVTLPVPTLTPSTFTGLGCGVSTSFFVSQNIPAGYTGTPPVLSVVPLEPNRITANLSAGITTVTRVNTDPGGGQSTLVRVSNGVNFTDFTITMTGAAPFACAAGSATPITDTTGLPLSLKVVGGGLPGTTVSRAFDGGTGPYTITSAAAGIAVVSNDGATFVATISVALGAPKVFFARTPVGTLAGAGSFITVRDSSVPQQTLIIVVTTN